MIKVGIGGFGYWGPNLLRVFQENPGWAAAAVSDIREARRQRAKQINPGLRLYESAEELIGAADIEAVAIATPVATHFSLARRALGRGKHVLVEKPLCRSAEEGRELIDLAARLEPCADHADHDEIQFGCHASGDHAFQAAVSEPNIDYNGSRVVRITPMRS
jgi:predicted dehydrogenase